MTRKFSRNYSLSVVVPFLAILILVTAAAVLAQTSGAGQPTGKANAVLAPAGTSALAQAERPLTPWTGAGSLPVSRSHTKRHGARPMASKMPVFLSVASYDPGGTYPQGVAIADLNGDGTQDVVVADANSGIVGVLLGNGHGWFEPPMTYSSGASGPWSVAVGDVNGDGIPDIVVANFFGRNCGVGVLLGNGDGTFQPAVLYGSSAVCGAQSVVIADLNGDGKLDLAVAANGAIVVLLGNGNGTFQPPVTYPWGGGSGTDWGSNSLAAADVNSDGKLDLVVATGTSDYPFGNGTVAVLLGNGDGTFQAAVDYDSGGWYASSLAIGDVNGDGKPDIVVANHCITYPCGVLGVLLGNGDGTFQAAATYGTGGMGWAQPVIADVNGDGKPDVVVANDCATSTCKSGNVAVLLGNGDGTFQPAVTHAFGGYGLAVAVADVNSDENPDVIATTNTRVAVLLTKTGVSTKTKVITSGSPTFLGQPVTFTATVTSDKGTIPDGEIIAFYDDITNLGFVKLVNGTAALTTSSLSAKTHSIKATYVGDATFRLGSGKVTQVVDKYSTTTSLSSSLNPSQSGQAVTFTATVTSAGPTPTGKVKFLDGTKSLGPRKLSGGVATLTTSKLAVGTHPITAQYSGDANNATSTSPVLDQVVQ